MYLPVQDTDVLRQGDIFDDVPRVDLSFDRLLIVQDEGIEESSYPEWQKSDDSEAVVAVTLSRVRAIVASQDCDNERAEYITMFEIVRVEEALGQQNLPSTPKKWASKILRLQTENPRYFYLPDDSSGVLGGRSVVDFRFPIRLRRHDLLNIRRHRSLRLAKVGRDHFRESLAHFFARFAVNGWYPLTPEELEAHGKGLPEALPPYPWQRDHSTGR